MCCFTPLEPGLWSISADRAGALCATWRDKCLPASGAHLKRGEAAYTTQPIACRLAPAPFDGLACWKKLLDYWYENVLGRGWRGSAGFPEACFQGMCACQWLLSTSLWLSSPAPSFYSHSHRKKSGTKKWWGHGEETERAQAFFRIDTFSCTSWNIVHHHINRAERGEIRPVCKKNVSRMSPWDISILIPSVHYLVHSLRVNMKCSKTLFFSQPEKMMT